jgi:glycosyltransferase involved in cell wall biosynthesis
LTQGRSDGNPISGPADGSIGRKPLRIAMIAATEYHSDARVRRQAEALAARGDAVTVISLGREGTRAFSHEVLDGVRIISVPVAKFRGRSSLRYLAYYARFAVNATRALLTIGRVDVVQVHSMPEALVFCAIPQRLRGVPVLLDVHDLTSKLFEAKMSPRWPLLLLRAVERASLLFASKTITVHASYARMLSREFGRAAGQVGVVMNVPDFGRWRPREWSPWSPDGIVFAFHGMLAHRYGVLEIADALAMVRRDLPRATLMIRGDGDARADLCDRLQTLSIASAVDMSAGYIPLEQMPRELQSAHVGLVPYRFDTFTREALPTKLLEYARLGMPVIATRLPHFVELFGDSLWWCEPGDSRALATAMVDVATNQDRAEDMAFAASRIVEKLSWDVQRLAYLGIIDGLSTRQELAGS